MGNLHKYYYPKKKDKQLGTRKFTKEKLPHLENKTRQHLLVYTSIFAFLKDWGLTA